MGIVQTIRNRVLPAKKDTVQKSLATTNDSIQPLSGFGHRKPERGVQVYTTSQLRNISGTDKDGRLITGSYDQSLFFLTLEERIMMFRMCVPVHAVVASRMHTISTMEFDIVSDKKDEDRIAQRLKNYRNLYKEYAKSTEPKFLVARTFLVKEIRETLTDALPDLSNFDTSLLRWKKKIQNQKTDQSEIIKEWMAEPNINYRYEEFVKAMVFDLMIHGSIALYKQHEDNRLENIYALPGGTVLPLKTKTVGGPNAYVQVIHGYDQPQIYFSDEIAFANYIPTTARAYGLVPLEALINLIIETLFFDRLMAEESDGTRPPEKLVIVTEQSPFGDLSKEFEAPMEVTEQNRLEEKINTPKFGAVMTFSGNNVQVVDLSRRDTMSIQMQRQKDIREEVGLVFQATPMEMNLAGSDNTSGRSTSEIQSQMYHSKAVLPIVKTIETLYNREILPFRYGVGWKVEYRGGKSDKEDLEILQMKVQTGVFAINELRGERGDDPFEGEQFDKPSGQPGGQPPDGSGGNPFNMKNVGGQQ